ncbi:MAG: GNAT family N-acetyltransferase [Mycoplasma sp.]
MIFTNRLIIRRYKMTDAILFFKYCSDVRVSLNTGFPTHESMLDSIKLLSSFTNNKEIFAIALKDSNELIGSIGLHKRGNYDSINKLNNLEIGYWLSPDYWGKNIMCEAVAAMTKYAFNNGIDALWVSHADFNTRSKRVIEKSGFKYSHSKHNNNSSKESLHHFYVKVKI